MTTFLVPIEGDPSFFTVGVVFLGELSEVSFPRDILLDDFFFKFELIAFANLLDNPFYVVVVALPCVVGLAKVVPIFGEAVDYFCIGDETLLELTFFLVGELIDFFI